MVISKEPLRSKLVVEENVIEQIMEMKYLGIRLSSYGNMEDESKEQVTKANKVTCCLNDTIWRKKYIKKETKSRIYKAVVRLIKTYTAKIGPDTAISQRILDAAEMTVLGKQGQTPLEMRDS
jgi:hypothetical protein